jgi:hypothetical protein
MTVILSGNDFVGVPTIVNQIADALVGHRPYSLVRIGDGENIVMAQEKVLSLEWIGTNVGWSHSTGYCGAALPNLELRDRMVKAVKQADMVGVFACDDLTQRIFSAFDIKPRSIFYAFDNLYMPMYKPFVDLIRKYPPLLVGNPAGRFAAYLHEKLGITVPGTVAINGYNELDTCIRQMAAIPHQWSLVSAGVNALVIADTMASEYGKVSIDFGHAPDNVMAPDYVDYWLAVD